MNNDASDLTAALAGSREAFARLYQRHAAVVLSLCRHCSSVADAEDAMQETFLRAFRKMHQLREPAGFRAWLYAIARRVCSERRRSATRRSHHELLLAENQVNDPPETVTASDAVQQFEQLELLSAALDTLPDNERLAIHLYYLDPDPPQAAADVIGVSRSGYYKLVTRARKRLAVAIREAQPT